MLAYIVEDLANDKNKKYSSAKGIMERHVLQDYLQPDVLKKLNSHEYVEKQDESISKEVDKFGPISKPEGNYFRLPDHVNYNFISTEEDVVKLEVLKKDKFIGVDSEWRPGLATYYKTKPSLFQISGANDAFCIDFVSLQKSDVLNKMMTEIFSSPDITIIGFDFGGDTREVSKKLPHLTFIKYIANLLDLQAYYKEMTGSNQVTGLAKVAQAILGKPICKGEQMSNWEKRPLRLSQQHYGALDGYVLVVIMEKLIKKAEEEMLDEYIDYVEPVDIRNQ